MAKKGIVVAGFSEARRRFVARFLKPKLVPDTLVENVFSKSTVRRLFLEANEHPDGEFSESIQRLLIYVVSSFGMANYAHLADLVDQKQSDTDNIFHEISGEYVYYRYYEEAGSNSLTYEGGRILINNIKPYPTFFHWSDGYGIENEPPEHLGFVFYANGNLFMLGYRKHVIRLAICDFRATGADGVIHGVLTSVRQEKSDPFAARFMMIRSSNLVEKQKFSHPENGESYFKGKLKGYKCWYLRGSI